MAKKEPAAKVAPPQPQTTEELQRMVDQMELSASASLHIPGKKNNKPVGAKSAFSALADEDSDDDLAAGVARKKGGPAVAQAKAKQKGAASSAKAKPLQPPGAQGLNPLPQRQKPSRGTPLDVWSGWTDPNSASGPKWAERSVEKVLTGQAAHYEEEEDPELAKYLWDRKKAAPKSDMASGARTAGKPQGVGPKAAQARQNPPPPPPQRQRQLLMKVMDMGFDESSARRALTTVGWSGVEDAVPLLLGG